MSDYYLAVDMGASGGRLILGHVEGGKLLLEEMHRFINGPIKRENSLIWDDEYIFGEITAGLVRCGRERKKPVSIGIDTWGVDYALADSSGTVIKPVYAYRDARTEPFHETVVPREELYRTTGTAFQPFNTIYQVLADKAAGRLDRAEYLLQLPEYFSHRLTGDLTNKQYNEYTMASTTGLLDARQKIWAENVFAGLGLPARLWKPVKEPPYDIGGLSADLQNKTGFDARVVMVASHDTASAVATVESGALYISSGTWSLLGVTGAPILTDEARLAGYSNEGAHNGGIRFLKNIMGLWIIQSVRHELNDVYSFAKLEILAKDTARVRAANRDCRDWTVDVNLPQFFAPPSMIGAIKAEYRRTGQKVPDTPGELAYCVYTSLARCYKTAIDDLEKITGKQYPAVSIIGGGGKDDYLNALTAEYTGKLVFAGPTEATAIGNILLQMQQAGDAAVQNGFPQLVRNSFDVKEFNSNT
jgi:rhamnulokinase